MNRKLVLRAIIIALLVALVPMGASLPVAEWLSTLQQWVLERPVQGAAMYIVAATIAGVLLTPGWIPMMAAGVLFGFAKGILCGIFGILGGATAAFLAGRLLFRSVVESKIAGDPRLTAIDRAVGYRAFAIVALTRLALLLPYNLLNYAFGLTRVGVRTYVVATGLGMLPAVMLYVHLGTLTMDIGQMLEDGGRPPAEWWWLSGMALLVVVAVVFMIQRAASRILREHLDTEQAGTERGEVDQEEELEVSIRKD